MDHFDYGCWRDAYSHPTTTSSSRSTQGPPFPLAKPSVQASITSTHYGNRTPVRAVLGNPRTQDFRVPLLTPRTEHTSDFQASAPHVLLSLPRRRMLGGAEKTFFSSAAGVHSHSDPDIVPTSLSVSLQPSPRVSVPLSYLPPRRLPFELPAIATSPASAYSGHQHSTVSPTLLLEDICHLEPASDLDASPSASHSTTALVSPSDFASLLATDKPYSDCPAAEFSTPLWSPLAFPPTLGRNDFSASRSGFTLSPKKEHCESFFTSGCEPMEEDDLGITPFLGIYADVNMRERVVQRQSSSLCVNPADVMAGPSGEFSPSARNTVSPGLRSSLSVNSNASTTAVDILSSGAQTLMNRRLSHTPDFTADFPDEALVSNAFSEEALSAIVSVLQSSIKQEEPRTVFREVVPPFAVNIKPLEPVAPQPIYPNHFATYPSNGFGVHHPSVSCKNAETRAPLPTLRMPLADLPLNHFQQLQNMSYDAHEPMGIPQANASATIPPMSPVLNAHAGIELDDLRQRAADYRTRHPNSELDRTFLQCFAGRLSTRGELLEEYRCYVVGCGQRNKRRDHILVHVGSHVEHRPWACQHCGMRFLRKNECKRHESSHEGRKPFSCSICAPTQERNFVRQDLLRRHMRVTHGIQEARTTAAKKRLGARNTKEENAECWP